MKVYPADKYENNSRLAVVTCYYNPLNYKTRRLNYDNFIATLEKSNVKHLTVECIFPGQDFTLPASPNVVRMTSSSVLWQRERLVNLAVSMLDKSMEYVAWIDCDLLFSNPNWIGDAVSSLETVPIVQLYEKCLRLPKDQLVYDGEGKISRSFASVVIKDQSVLGPTSTEKHGITGGAWAARREVFQHCGLYEHAIVGGADDYIAHAMFGDFNGLCLRSKMYEDPFVIGHYLEWAERFYQVIRGKVGVVSGSILHLWHGEIENRQYFIRHKILNDLGYNPYRDIVSRKGLPLEWSENASSKLRDWVVEYFAERAEDG